LIHRRTFNAMLAGLVAAASKPSVLRTEGRPEIVLKAEFAAHVPSVIEIEHHGAHALVRTASRLVPTPRSEWPGVAMSGDAARMSACATSLFELRVYRSGSARLGPCLERVFPRAGIDPLLRGDLAYLIPFESLTAREQAWNSLNGDPEWTQVRGDVDSYQFGLYRVSA
jgi:hypothetical protein